MGNLVKNQRVVYYDLLRVAATFAVILIHISGSYFGEKNPSSFDWQIYNFYDGISRWSVPVFVMISGALFLKAEVNLEKLFKKNIIRIVTAFIFWSLAYGIFEIIVKNRRIKLALGEMLFGHYHMWFLFMIVGLYLAVPLLKKITESTKLTVYFLILSLIFSVIIPQGIDIVSLFSESIGDTLIEISDCVGIKNAVGYSGYFVLGYYLSSIEIDRKNRKLIYLLGVIGFVGTVGLTSLLSIIKKEPLLTMQEYFSSTVLMESVAVFVFFKYSNPKLSEKSVRILSGLSKYSFGVYLVHPMILETFSRLGLDVQTFSPILSIPVILIAGAVVSFVISALLNRIPVLKKYIV